MNRPSPVPGFALPPAVDAAELLEDQALVFGAGFPGRRRRRRRRMCPSSAVARTRTSPPRRRVLDGVVDQVRDHLAQPLAVAAHARQRRRERRVLDAHLVLTELRRGRDVADELGDVDVAERVAERPRLDPRRVEHVADERGEPARLVARSARGTTRAAPASARASAACSVRAAPITAAIGLRSSCETSETKSARSAERRRSSSAVPRSASYDADVLHRGRDQAAEQRHELDLVRA